MTVVCTVVVSCTTTSSLELELDPCLSSITVVVPSACSMTVVVVLLLLHQQARQINMKQTTAAMAKITGLVYVLGLGTALHIGSDL